MSVEGGYFLRGCDNFLVDDNLATSGRLHALSITRRPTRASGGGVR